MSPESSKDTLPTNSEGFVKFLHQRAINRSLDLLQDEIFPWILEAVATQKEEETVIHLARDLRKHLLSGGSAKDFLETFPEHKDVEFGHLMSDVEVFARSLPQPLAPQQGVGALPMPVSEEPEAVQEATVYQAESIEGDSRLQTLVSTYAPVKELFSNQAFWYEDKTTQEVYTSRVNIEELVEHGSKETVALNRKATFTQTLIPKWKKHMGRKDLGRRIPGMGVDMFYSQEEVIEFLFFLHENLGKSIRSPYQLREEGGYEGRDYSHHASSKKKV
jgi:hypothetical protein